MYYVSPTFQRQPYTCGISSIRPHGLPADLALSTARNLFIRHSILLVFIVLYYFHSIFSFPLKISHLIIRRAVYNDFNFIAQCIASQAFLRNLGGSLHNVVIIAFCMSACLKILTPKSITNLNSSWGFSYHVCNPLSYCLSNHGKIHPRKLDIPFLEVCLS